MIRSTVTHLFILLFLFIVFSCNNDTKQDQATKKIVPDTVIKKSSRVVISADSGFQKNVYTISNLGCTISFSVYHPNSANKGSMTNYSACNLPLTQQREIYEEILMQIFEDEDSIKTVFWGSLYEKDKLDNEMALRLGLACKESQVWDSKKGKLKNSAESINLFVKEIANSKMIYPEIKKLFEEVGYKIRISSVEQVSINKAGELPYFSELKEHGIDASEKFPANAQLWFSLEKIVSIE